jgi:intracellular septation protein
MSPAIKLLCEIGPLGVFFVAYRFWGLIPASLAVTVATILATAISYALERKVAWVPLISTAILTLMSLTTVLSGNPMFIKIKPTLVNLIFASILLIGVWRKKGLLKYLFGQSGLSMSDSAWIAFSARWGYYFLALALLNEWVWRNFEEATWVNFKVFGMLPITIIFTLCQLPFLKRHKQEV